MKKQSAGRNGGIPLLFEKKFVSGLEQANSFC
jgi:hypothetical protein